jgi:FkbM family methyltransferase
MNQPLLRVLRTLARPLLGKGYWDAPVLRSIASWYKKAFRPEFVMIEGDRFYLNYDDGWFSTYVAVHGYWEKTESDLIRRYVRPGMRALDLGANIGYYTLILSNLVGPQGKVVAFEPEPHCYELLKKNVAGLKNRNVEIVPSAAWDTTGEIEFYVNAEDTMDHTAVAIREKSLRRTVRATAVDDYIGDGTFDFIKMDIQGGEGHALKGMRRMFERKPPEVMITEFWPAALRKAGTPPEELFDWLLGLGYHIQAINEEEDEIYPVSLDDLLRMSEGNDAKFFNLLCLRQSATGAPAS